jgi:hypothetical protein
LAEPPTVKIAWNAVTGRLYTVTLATSPSAPFTAAPDFVDVAGTGSAMVYTNTATDLPGTRFYRIHVRPPW